MIIGGKVAMSVRGKCKPLFQDVWQGRQEMKNGTLKERLFQERGILVFAGRGWQYSYKKEIYARNEIWESHSQSTLLRENKGMGI